MEIRNLNAFLKVAALQNFTQASRELGYSQSNVSTQIQQLEQEVGAPLFNRIGRRISLTQYGEELLPYAQQIVSVALQMENFLKSEEALGGIVKIGFVESLFSLLPEEVFIQYQERFPHVKIELTVDGTQMLKEHLQQGILDMACLIDAPLDETQWQCWYKADVPITVICNPNHFLAHKKKVRLQDLSEQKFVLMEESAPYNIQFQQLLDSNRITLQPVLRLQSSDKACRLVEKSDFLSVLPYYAVETSAQEGRVKILKITGVEPKQSVQIVLHKSKVIIPQIEGMMEAIRHVLPQAGIRKS